MSSSSLGPGQLDVYVFERRPSHILHICRYLRPEETTHRKTDTFWPDEVIKSKETTYHPCAEVIGRCFVLHRDQFPFGRPKPHLWDHTTPIYLCENRYSLDNTTRPFTKITNWKPIDQDSMDAFSTPLQLYKSPSPFLRGVSGPGRLLTDAEVKTMQQAGEAAECVTRLFLLVGVGIDDSTDVHRQRSDHRSEPSRQLFRATCRRRPPPSDRSERRSPRRSCRSSRCVSHSSPVAAEV